jgi:hypothetical protein
MSSNQLVEELGSFPRDHNQPPLGEEIAETLMPFRKRQADILDVADTARIENDFDAERVVDLVKICRSFEQELDGERARLKAPYLAACQQIDRAFGALSRPVAVARYGEDGKGGLLKLIDNHRRQKEEAAQAERERLLSEQRLREAEAEAARRAAEEQRAAGSGGVAAELAAIQAEQEAARLAREAAAVRAEPIRSDLGTVGNLRVIEWKILELRQVVGWLMRNPDLRGQLETAVRTLLDKYLRGLGVKAIENGAGRIPGTDVRVVHRAKVR